MAQLEYTFQAPIVKQVSGLISSQINIEALAQLWTEKSKRRVTVNFFRETVCVYSVSDLHLKLFKQHLLDKFLIKKL